jgi:hypothetical protein
MQTRINHWFDAREAFGVVQVNTIVVIMSIFALTGALAAFIAAFA